MCSCKDCGNIDVIDAGDELVEEFDEVNDDYESDDDY